MNYLLVYNPVSGKGKFDKKIPFIKKYFNKLNKDLVVFRSSQAGDIESRVSSTDVKEYDVIIVAGGDGTVNEAINGLMKLEERPNLAIIPSGTANDVASILGMSKCLKKTLKIICHTNPVGMDVNQINERYFLYTTAAGVLTKISYDIPRENLKKYGYLAYLQEGAKDIFRKYRMPLKVLHDSGEVSGEFMLALGLGIKRVGGLRLSLFSKAKLNDGKFELRLIGNKKFFRIAKLALFLITFGFYKSSKDVHISSKCYKITASDDVVWNTDGEKATKGSIEILVKNKAIKVYASKRSKKKYFIV